MKANLLTTVKWQ